MRKLPELSPELEAHRIADNKRWRTVPKRPFDLDEVIHYDTYLVVHYRRDGNSKWCHYINHIQKSNGKKRTFRDIYSYFVEREGFVAAYGHALFEHRDFYYCRSRYFLFDMNTPPVLSVKHLDKYLWYEKR